MNNIKKFISTWVCLILAFSFITNVNITSLAVNIPMVEINDDGTALKKGEHNVKHADGTITKEKFGVEYTDAEAKKATHVYNKILIEYKGIVVFISGIALLSMIMFFILNFIELGNSRGNPQARQKAINGLIISGVATAGLGSVNLIVQLFYNMIKTSDN